MDDKTTIASLNLTLSSYKSLLSEYAQRTRHAEELVGLHLQGANFESIAQVVKKHMEERSNERFLHLVSIVQTTILLLTEAQTANTLEELKELIGSAVKSLIMCMGSLTELDKKDREMKQSSMMNKLTNSQPNGNLQQDSK